MARCGQYTREYAQLAATRAPKSEWAWSRLEEANMSVVQVMGYSEGGLAADRTPFFGLKTPPELKRLTQLCKSLEQPTFRKILKGESLI